MIYVESFTSLDCSSQLSKISSDYTSKIYVDCLTFLNLQASMLRPIKMLNECLFLAISNFFVLN